MAYIQPLLGQQLVIQVGDGATPELYSAPALINTSRGFAFSTNVESDELMDLADQGAPAQMIRRVKSVDLKIDGAGLVHKPDVAMWLNWVSKALIKNVKITDGINTITAPFVLTSFQVNGERLKSAECSISLEVAGPFTITPAV